MLSLIRAIGQTIILGILGILAFLGFEIDHTILSTTDVDENNIKQDTTLVDLLNIDEAGFQKKNQFFSFDTIINFFGDTTTNLFNTLDQGSAEATFLHEISIWDAFKQSVPIENVILKPELESELDKVTEEQTPPPPTTVLDEDSKPDTIDIDPFIDQPTVEKPQDHKTAATEIDDEIIPEYELRGKVGNFAEVAVNIVCKQQMGSLISATTGSGVIVSPYGVVLTNAHVAQHVLLEDSGHNTSCVIYRNNVSDYGYRVDVIYFPLKWMQNNHNSINETNPRGTGEHDFALLLITGSTKRSKEKHLFPYAEISLDNDNYRIGSTINITGYPGGVSQLFNMDRSGNLNTDRSTIEQVYSFNRLNNIDLFSTAPTHVAQKGASGGGIYSFNDLIGITVTVSGNEGVKSINSITTKYISSALEEEYGKNLLQILSEDPKIHLNHFQTNLLNKIASFINN